MGRRAERGAAPERRAAVGAARAEGVQIGLRDAIVSDGRAVGGIIYDGVLVERVSDEGSDVPSETLRRWSSAVLRKTGLSVHLASKPMAVSPEWDASNGDLRRVQSIEEEAYTCC